MQLMRLADVPLDRRDRVFRYSQSRAVIGATILAVLAFGAFIFGWQKDLWLPYYLAAVIVIGLLIFHKLIIARFRPSNWLLRMTDHGLFIKFRSYLNNHFDDQDLTVLFLPYSEIRSARSVKERREVPDFDRGKSVGNDDEKTEDYRVRARRRLNAAGQSPGQGARTAIQQIRHRRRQNLNPLSTSPGSTHD